MPARRLVAALVPLALVAAACGQKSGVSGSDAGSDAGAGDGATPTAAPATEPPGTEPPGTEGPGTEPGGTEPGGSAPTDTGATTPPATGETTPATQPAEGPFEPGPDDTGGVSDDEIVIGIHAPVTGASPVPATSFDIGKDIYWQFLAENDPDRLFGRTVRVVFRDDEFNPQNAVRVCRQMVEDEGAFLLIGGAGADQISACAQYASENGIPYLSAGVNEEGLADLETYFSTTLTYAEQAPLIIAQLQEQGFTEGALVVADTPSFTDFIDAMKAAADEAGFTFIYEKQINKDASPAESATIAQELKNSGAEAVVLLASAVVFVLGLAPGAANQGYAPQWIGPGVSSGLNAVAAIGCPNVANAEFFSPTPNLDVIDELDPDFQPAYEQFVGDPADDIGIQLWSINKAVAAMLEATGPELGRAAFMNTLVTTPEFDNGIYPPIRYTPDDHFGGTGAHLLKANCETKLYDTFKQFVEAG